MKAECKRPALDGNVRQSYEISWGNAKGIVWEHNTDIGDARANRNQPGTHGKYRALAREEYRKENV